MEDLTIKNPWLGLESYKEGEVLYGRDDDIRDLSQCVLNDVDTLLYGKSGIGKSSILNAGIIPAARRHGFLPVIVRLSHKEQQKYLYQIKESIANAMIPIPLDEYGNQIKLTSKEQQQRDAELKKRIVKVVDCKDAGKESLYEYYHRHTFYDAEGRRIRLLIIFDQFEEIFTLQSDEPTKKSFFAELADLLNDKMPEELQKNSVIQHDGLQQAKIKDDDDFDTVFNDIDIGDKSDIDYYVNDNEIHFVFTIREDFLSEFEYYSASIPSLKQNRYGLRPINEEQAAQIIMRPVPGLISKSVAKLIIEKVTGKTDFKLDGIPEIEVDSAVLSLYLNRLYEAKTGENITDELVEAKGSEIIADFYKDAISSISDSTIEYLEGMLLNGKGRRDNITVFDAINDGGVTENELDVLINKKKILRQFNYAGDLRIEYVHDILCPVVKTHKEERLFIKKQAEENARREKEKEEEDARIEKERQIQEEKLRKAEEEKQILLRKQKLQEEENRLLKRKQEEELARAEREKMHQQEQLERAEKERKLLLRQQELQEEENRMLVLKQEEERRRQEREKQELKEKNKRYQKKVKRNRFYFLLVTILAVIASPFIYNYAFPAEQWQLYLVEDQTVGSENYWKADVSILNETSDTLYPVQTLDKSHFQTAYPSHRNNKVRIVIQFLAGNFNTIDTVVDVRDSLTIPISRAHGRIKYEGKVIGSDSGQPIKNAVVIVGGQITKTNHHGYFTLFVEQSDISNDGTIKIYKSGYGLIDTKMGNGVPYKLKAEDPKAFEKRLSLIEEKLSSNGFEMVGEIAGKSCHLRACIMKDSIWGAYYYNKTKEDIKEIIRKNNKNKKDTIHAEIVFSGKVNEDRSFHLDCCDWVYNIEELNGRINEDNSWEGYWHSYSPNLQKFKFVITHP